MKKQLIDVLLVEDDRDLALSIADYLSYERIRCDHAFNGLAGFNLARKNHYDVILLDIMLPRMDGITVCQQLRTHGDDTPILMLTAKDTLDDKASGFSAGTDDYLVKPFALKELVMRIQSLSKRKSGQVKNIWVEDLVFESDLRQVRRAGQEIKLTPSGLLLLEILMWKSPAIVSKRELEEALWPDDAPDSNNLKVQLYQLRQKVDKPFPTKLIETVPGHGFRIVGRP
ncbi:TPA: response regulator transcription factor [Vibrio vulnificus]|uniref:response regulator transcription factor n=1 Tax=Vibrio vulnificus TaxID=672 RepID=UPI0005441797|nr:response regulator transcription factor [Vibrio vulnificus]KHF85994.1 XRE family transcriptional regulator [Vibrio vulnificus]KHF90533.1 XRE family transcriptional regulator [Vibrio vulnificus]RZR26811.1 DNA-binding response regulator [Vibrio vulnificus]HAS8290890.1 response regulator transcription factor [Vibrio vulnificus]HAS8335022.1 response regulator transcription factor [Vibrio vulnificus]